MKEHPILFSAPMVQAILAGRKTQTRRIAKAGFNCNALPFAKLEAYDNPKLGLQAYFKDGDSFMGTKCPYGKTGDVLWVRESFRKFCPDVDTTPYETITEYAASENSGILYESDGDGFQIFNKDGSERMIGWKPSIHMPKAAARIWLQIESVRVERLQDISEEDATAEGVEPIEFQGVHGWKDYSDGITAPIPFDSAVPSFCSLWLSINGSESLHANPWVWAITFKVLSTTGRPAFDHMTLAEKQAA